MEGKSCSILGYPVIRDRSVYRKLRAMATKNLWLD
jgi:hypothetical protein